MLLADVVQASAEVATTRSRKAKVAIIAAVLTRLGSAEIRPATALLAGELPGGRTGVGWSTLSSVRAEPASRPTLSIMSVAEQIDRLRTMTDAGSAQRRSEVLWGLLSAATEAEQEFLVRLLGGELRQGALEGVMV